MDQGRPFTRAWSQVHGAVRARAYNDAAGAVRSSWFTLLSGPSHEVAPVLEPVPPGVLEQYPLLSALLGHSQLSVPARRPQALRRLAQAEAAASAPGARMRQLDRALILAGHAEVQRTLGRVEAAVAASGAALAALEGWSPAAGAEARTAEDAYAHLGLSLLLSGARQQALEALERGVLAAETSGEPATGVLLAALALVSAADGDLVAARARVEQAHGLQMAMAPGDVALLEAAETVLAVEQADHRWASPPAEMPAARAGSDVYWPISVTAEAMGYWVNGHPGRALARLDHAVTLRGPEGRTVAARGMVAPLRAGLHLALGRPNTAEAVLEQDSRDPVSRELGRARIALLLGRHGAALKHLRSVAVAQLSPREQAEATALEAAALLRFSTGPRVDAVIDHLGSLLADSGLRVPLLLLPPSDFGRVRDALRSAGYGGTLGLDRLAPLMLDVTGDVLTPRETAVLRALVDHSSHTALATELNVSVNTVKSQLRSVYRKLGVSTRDEAIAVALDRHLTVERE